jgi:elongation factor G
MGQLHIEVVVGKLKKRYKVEVNLKKPKIPYRETIKGAAEGHGRHKKQTGGHGQFGDCRIRMKPLPRGGDFKFVDDIFGGSIPKNFIPAVEKGIQDARVRGFVAGYPMVDFQVELFDGQYHDVDSSEMSFKIAGSLAYKDAVAKCRPTLLEPVMKVEIVVPGDFAGSVMGDLSSRRGRPQGMEGGQGTLQVIRAEVPLSEMLSYDGELTSMTGGRGSYHMEMSHYDEVPGHLQDKIVAAYKAERGEQKEEE